MNFENIEHLSIDNKNVIKLEVDDITLWKGLPEGYRRIEYIRTTGASGDKQYLDTGLYMWEDSRVICEFAYIRGLNHYGARNTTTSKTFSLRMNSNKLQHCYNTSSFVANTIREPGKKYVIDQNKNLFYVDGELQLNANGETLSYPSTSFKTPRTFCLGRIHAAGDGSYYGDGRYYSCKIYSREQEGEGIRLLRDLVPCINPAGKPGMYDFVFGKFYGNVGAGEFYTNETENQMPASANTYNLNRTEEEFEEE